MLLPEQILFKILSQFIDVIKADFNANTDERNTILYNMFNGISIGEYNYYKEAKSLLLRDAGDPNSLKVRLFFDTSRAGLPSIHITLPSESSDRGANGIGFDKGYEEAYRSQDNTEYAEVNTRTFSITYQIVCTSGNTFEVLIMYHLLKCLFISFIDSLELSGLQNPKISGQDLDLRDYFAPDIVFSRGLNVDFFYTVSVSEAIKQKTMAHVWIEDTTVIDGTTEGLAEINQQII